ncbi:hypothetical protein NL676_033752 [Syzygium grande]|nr:hypothetical protein NL676_033752 [Syzygium grande]
MKGEWPLLGFEARVNGLSRFHSHADKDRRGQSPSSPGASQGVEKAEVCKECNNPCTDVRFSKFPQNMTFLHRYLPNLIVLINPLNSS